MIQKLLLPILLRSRNSCDKFLNNEGVKQNLFKADVCSVKPFIPIKTFIALFSCSSAWSEPIATKGIEILLILVMCKKIFDKII